MRLRDLAAVAVLLAAVGCHPGPVVNTGPAPPPAGGTIAGAVRASGTVPLAARKVTAIDVKTGQRFETSTASNGGYTLQVPQGTYRLEVELGPDETLSKGPGETEVNEGDLDPDRDFVITVRSPRV